jgi:putative transposase
MTDAAFIYHVFNRAVKGTELFESRDGYLEFQNLLLQARLRTPIRILAYCLMPNHWHLLLWPYNEGDLSDFMKWLCTTHAARWNKARGLTGRGAVYQSRFKSVPVDKEVNLLRVWRYVERNPLTAGLVPNAEAWRWGSLWDRIRASEFIDSGPLPLPHNWTEIVNGPQTEEELLLPRAD